MTDEIEGLVHDTKVLVVDEYDEHREIICKALRDYGFDEENLICCSSVKEAEPLIDSVQIIFLEASEARCEVTGYNMHTVVTNWQQKGKDVFLSAYVRDLGRFTRVASIYAEQFIAKPLNPFTLNSALDQWADLARIDNLLASSGGCTCGIKG